MRNHHLSIGIVSIFLAVSACTTTVPKEMTLSDSNHRTIDDHPGNDLDDMRLACAEAMLNASLATKASNILDRVLSTTAPTIIEVDATLNDVGMFKQDLAVTYHCEFQDGHLTLNTWTKGLKDREKSYGSN